MLLAFCPIDFTIFKSFVQIILATNIAESSVTIPDVAYVIDSCRSLQVYWDGNRKIDTSELIWVSKSQVLVFPTVSSHLNLTLSCLHI